MNFLSTASLGSQPHCDTQAGQTAIGDVVEKLGDNLMLVHEDKSNQWWFGTWGDGLYRYNGKNIVHFTTKHGLSHNRIDQILEDSSGRLLVSTPLGVNRFDGEKFSLVKESKFSEWKLKPNDLWLISPKYDGEVFRYDGEILHSLQLPKVKIAEDFAAKHPSAASLYGVYTIYRDKLDHVWFGTAGVGVSRYDGNRFEWLTSDDVNELHEGPANGVRSMVEDHEGRFWFNTRYRYAILRSPLSLPNEPDPEGIFQRLPGIGSLVGTPDGEYEYLSITKDRNNAIWIATYQNGAFRFDGNQLQHFPIMEGPKTVKLFTVYADRSGTVWLGTHENGAYRFNGTSFERFVPTQAANCRAIE